MDLPPDLQHRYLAAHPDAAAVGAEPDEPAGSAGAVPVNSPPRRAVSATVAESPPLAQPSALPLNSAGVALPVLCDGRPDLIALEYWGGPKCRELYLRRLEILNALGDALTDGAQGNKLETCRQVAEHFGVSVSLVCSLARAVRRGGYAGLVPRWGSRSRCSIAAELQPRILAAYQTPARPTYRQVWLAVADEARRRGLPLPSYAGIRACVQRNILPMLSDSLRYGVKKWNNEYRFHVVRDPELLEPNELWCGDHRLADTMVMWPDGKPRRPWLTAFCDVASGRLVGWTLRDRPSSDGVAQALRRGILGFEERDLDGNVRAFTACGLPRGLYLDHGKEFSGGAMRRGDAKCRNPKSKIQNGRWHPAELPEEEAATVFTELGIGVCQAIPYQPWSKPIEAFFGAFASRIENLIVGWCGRDAQHRPEVLLALIDRGALLSLDDYARVFAGWCHDWNTAHVVGHRRKKPPMAYYNGFTAQVPDQRALDTLLLRASRRRVHNHGVEIKGLGRYMSEEPGFVSLTGLEVECRFCPEEAEHVIAIDLRTGSRFLLDRQPDATWSMLYGGEIDEANRRAQRIRTSQRQVIRQAADEVLSALTPEVADPTGTMALAAGRLRRLRGGNKRLADEGDAPRRRISKGTRPDAASRERGSAVSRAWTDEDEAAAEEARRFREEGLERTREMGRKAEQEARERRRIWHPEDEAVAAERRKLHDEHEAWLTEGGRQVFLRWGEGKPDELRKYWTDRGMPDVGEEWAREAEAREAEERKKRAEVCGQ